MTPHRRPETVAGWFRSRGFDEPVRGEAEGVAMIAERR